MEGIYNSGLVATSILVAILAAYTALDMADRVNRSRKGTAVLWVCGGGLAMGVGIWSMHFIGMLAFQLPIPVSYDPFITLVSMGAAIVSSAFALWLTSRSTLPKWRIIPGALLMGLGIACMHYLGMEAMLMSPGLSYHHGWFVFSIAVAVIASWTALRVFLHLQNQQRWSTRLAASVVLGLGIVGMHYTGMAATQISPDAVCGAAVNHNAVNPTLLAVIVSLLTTTALGIVLTLSLMDKKLESRMLRMRNAMLSLSLEEANSELSQAASKDPLTNLPNRRLFMAALTALLEEEPTARQGHMLIVMDIVDFQRINDAYGHTLGDQLLVKIAAKLEEAIRPGETASRIGNDQFALLTRSNPDATHDLAETLLSRISQGMHIEKRKIFISANVGYVDCATVAEDAETLLSYAFHALRHSRDYGRNQSLAFASWMVENDARHLHLLDELQSAFENDQLSAVYQPRARTRDSTVTGAEALFFWDHPQLGTIADERIRELAARNCLSDELGRWLLEQACAQLALWHRAGQQNWTMSVTLCARQYQDSSLVRTVRQLLEKHDLPARSLVLGIPEGVMLNDNSASLAVINSLASLGVGLSIDDFGSGHASLLHLKMLPVTELKFGPPFIQEMTVGSTDSMIISAVISLVHGLDMEVVANGVNNREQRTQLERMGCNYLQGPLVGQIVKPSRFIQLHAARPLTMCEDVDPETGNPIASANQGLSPPLG